KLNAPLESVYPSALTELVEQRRSMVTDSGGGPPSYIRTRPVIQMGRGACGGLEGVWLRVDGTLPGVGVGLGLGVVVPLPVLGAAGAGLVEPPCCAIPGETSKNIAATNIIA